MAQANNSDVYLCVKEAPGKGKAVFATQDLPAGTAVWKELSFACLPRARAKKTICASCFKVHVQEELTQTCKRCHKVFYCNVRCRKLDASFHAAACHAFDVIPSLSAKYSIDSEILELLVVVLAHLSEPPSPSEQTAPEFFHAAPEAVLQLVALTEVFSPQFVVDIKACMAALQAASQHKLDPANKFDPVQLVGIIKTNVHGDIDDLTVGLFPGLSMLCHSCQPNCVYSISNGKVLVRTSEAVPKDAELTIAYIDDVGMSYHRRQNYLLRSRHFRCACVRCVREGAPGGIDYFESFLCDTADCAGLVRVDIDSEQPNDKECACPVCNRARPLSFFRDFVAKELGPKLEQVSLRYDTEAYAGSAVICRSIAAAAEKVLHPFHEVLYTSYPLMSLACERDHDYPQACHYARLRLQALQAASPAHSMEAAELHGRIGTLLELQAAQAKTKSPAEVWEKIRLGLRAKAAEHFNQAREHSTVCRGTT